MMDRNKHLALAIVVLISLAGITLGTFVYLSKSPKTVSPPVYEEIYSSTEEIHRWIRKVNYALYESLSQSGTQEKDIFFVNIQPRHENGNVWDFCEISITCPNRDAAETLRHIVIRELAGVGPDIILKEETAADGTAVVHVSVGDFHTHEVMLGFKREEPREHVRPDVRPKVAVILDDLGYKKEVAFWFLRAEMPLTFSVLPGAPFTRSIAEDIKENGGEMMLHLPMEPKNYPEVNPGPGALLLSMEGKEIREILEEDLKQVPHVSGVNNHMGSSFTENPEKMRVVLEELQKRDLFFIDSRTTSGSVGYKLAGELGLPTNKRGVFLDNDLDPRAIEIQVDRLLSMARHSGSAIGICHPHPETLEVLRKYFPKITQEFQVVRVSELVHESKSDKEGAN
jgi:polysaccharide deacetylase 2 family uncharacterized protein YibQ